LSANYDATPLPGVSFFTLFLFLFSYGKTRLVGVLFGVVGFVLVTVLGKGKRRERERRGALLEGEFIFQWKWGLLSSPHGWDV